ncbi:glycosyltransferase family 2 protein [Leucobacter sp. CSA1]|uniref:Glycosyltransferase family 2 protein n=1 Tax=Leucobacter chromiisoli TaxID=2796471 RepID=A0A934Q6W6_9MICO|nr:glycosyltransferase family 2 protein [Leucobacter chromiisoli]MBK0417667.1 glycosyltransferase family 2 protein [Leucobacter chromiisoli]
MPRAETPPAGRAPRVAFVTVSYGSGNALGPFLSSLRRFHSPEHPVVVVDNKPDHESAEALAAQYGARYVPLPENPGYGAGMNAGVRALEEGGERDCDAYFFCNPDVTFTQETATALAAAMLSQPGVGSIGPRLFNDDGTVYPSARNIPSVGTGVGHALLGRVWRGNPWTRAYQDAANYDSARSAGSLSGAAVMVRADVYREIGGWDEAYFMHFEDIDLGFRIGLAGYENRYDPSVSVVHSGAHSTKKHAEAVERAMTDSAVRFMGKRYPGPLRAPIRWAITLGLRARGALKLASIRRSSARDRPSRSHSGGPNYT